MVTNTLSLVSRLHYKTWPPLSLYPYFSGTAAVIRSLPANNWWSYLRAGLPYQGNLLLCNLIGLETGDLFKLNSITWLTSHLDWAKPYHASQVVSDVYLWHFTCLWCQFWFPHQYSNETILLLIPGMCGDFLELLIWGIELLQQYFLNHLWCLGALCPK